MSESGKIERPMADIDRPDGGTVPFEPKIVGFLCNWCSYAGADLAGVSRLKYPANVRIIRVMCSGRVEPAFVLKAFAEGADGVLISGCHPGDCHYLEGNYKAVARARMMEHLLAQFGVEPERFRLTWASANEGEKFAGIVKEMVEAIRPLGPFRRPSVRMDDLARASVLAESDRPAEPGDVRVVAAAGAAGGASAVGGASGAGSVGGETGE